MRVRERVGGREEGLERGNKGEIEEGERDSNSVREKVDGWRER